MLLMPDVLQVVRTVLPDGRHVLFKAVRKDGMVVAVGVSAETGKLESEYHVPETTNWFGGQLDAGQPNVRGARMCGLELRICGRCRFLRHRSSLYENGSPDYEDRLRRRISRGFAHFRLRFLTSSVKNGLP